MDTTALTPGALTALLIEGIKWLYRKIINNPLYDFPKLFYILTIPISNFFMPFLISYLGISIPLPVFHSVEDVIKVVITLVLNSLISYITFTLGIKPLREYKPANNLD